MGSTNKLFTGINNGLGLDLWYEIQPFTAVTSNGPKWTTSAQSVAKHKKDDNTLPIYTSIFKGKGGEALSSFVDSNLSVNTDDRVNDTSLVSTINYLQQWDSTFLDYADFAYLKNLGVYPTNRLMIARRFEGPAQNNLYKIGLGKDKKENTTRLFSGKPMATMISWIPDDSDFFNITFGEEWTDLVEASFGSIVNSIGEDFFGKGTTKAGDFVKGGLGIFSLPGWTEGIQIRVAQNLKIADYEPNNPPSGNPNLIKKAQHRKLVGKEVAGAGLNSSFAIKFTVEYEQKFINGVDPSLVYLDIIQKCLIFGTSKSVFMFNSNFENQSNDFIKNLVSGDTNALLKSIVELVVNLTKSLNDVLKELSSTLSSNNSDVLGSVYQIGEDIFKDLSTFNPNNPTSQTLQTPSKLILGSLVSKYRIKLFAVIQSLTGAPSGYWHVTLGNPKKPFFSSGDLITSGVTMTFGKVLSYNDLPSTIKIDFTLVPARDLGGQEIMDRFNTGQGRTYHSRKRSYYEVQEIDKDGKNYNYEEKWKDKLSESLKENNPGPGSSGVMNDGTRVTEQQ